MMSISELFEKYPPRPRTPYTEGPWHLERQTGGEFTAIGEPIAVVGGKATGETVEFIIGRCCDYGPHGPVQTTANAKLIAASPLLLEACQAALATATGAVAEQLNEAIDVALNGEKR